MSCTCPRYTYPRSFSELCPWCQDTNRAHKRIAAGMAALASDSRPRAGWDASVLAAVSAAPPPRRWLVPVALLCLAAIVLVGAKVFHLGRRVAPVSIKLHVDQPAGDR